MKCKQLLCVFTLFSILCTSAATTALAAGSVAAYKIHSGDSLASIANQLNDGSSWKSIYDLNRKVLSSPDKLYAGLEIQLPASENSDFVPSNDAFTENWTESDWDSFSGLALDDRRAYLRYTKFEPEISDLIELVAPATAGYLYDFGGRYKAPSIVYEQLYGHTAEDVSIEDMEDILSYTFVIPAETYTEDVLYVLEILEKKGWTINKIENRWLNSDGPDFGVYCSCTVNEDYIVSVQFHTEESLSAKGNENAPQEQPQATDPSAIPIPEGIENIENRSAEAET